MYGREIIWGRDGNTGWIDLLEKKKLNDFKITGNWREDHNAVVGESKDGAAHLVFGEDDWKSYELSMGVTVVQAGNAQILFRLDNEPPGHYLVDFLCGWYAIAVSRVDRNPDGEGLKKLSVVNYNDLREGREFRLEVAVRDYSITTYINGKLVNQVTDETYKKGKVSLSAYQGVVKYKDIKYRILE